MTTATSDLLDRPGSDRRKGLELPGPYLLFLGDTVEPGYAKTAFGLRDWAPDRCIGEFALTGASVTAGLPPLNPSEAYARGARALVIGVANAGGVIPDAWAEALAEALHAGLDIVSGMHVRLAEVPRLGTLAVRLGRRLIDVRTPPPAIPVATGIKRPGRRLLTVGTDCALGKKYTALAIVRGLHGRGLDVDFRATGQTGIMIAGSGMPIDSVVADFVAGAAEMLSPAAAPHHLDVIEGQGSLFHPAYAGVTLGLLHGSQPDMFVVCHSPGRSCVLGHPHVPLPSIERVIEQTAALGRLTNPDIRCVGISLNTAGMDAGAAEAELEATEKRVGLPAADPLRGGPRLERLMDACCA